LKSVFATFASVFAHVEVWQTLPGDLMLVGAKRPIVYHGAELATQLASEPYRSALALTWRATDLHGFVAHFLADDKVVRLLAADPGVPLNTDDRSVVEFAFARTLGQDRSIDDDLRALAASMGGNRPALEGAEIDWGAVETARVAFHVSERPSIAIAT